MDRILKVHKNCDLVVKNRERISFRAILRQVHIFFFNFDPACMYFFCCVGSVDVDGGGTSVLVMVVLLLVAVVLLAVVWLMLVIVALVVSYWQC